MLSVPSSTSRLHTESRPDGLHIRLPSTDVPLLSALMRRLRSQTTPEARWLHLGRDGVTLPDGQHIALAAITRIDDQGAICTAAGAVALPGGLSVTERDQVRAALREHRARHVAHQALRSMILIR